MAPHPPTPPPGPTGPGSPQDMPPAAGPHPMDSFDPSQRPQPIRDELLARLYPAGDTVVVDRVVDVHIGKLRQKIEAVPSTPQYILTVRGIGYKFAEGQPQGTGSTR